MKNWFMGMDGVVVESIFKIDFYYYFVKVYVVFWNGMVFFCIYFVEKVVVGFVEK